MRKSADLDEFDLAILEILQADSTVPQREIGERINLSAPAVQRRIKRMQATGVIQANIAVVDPAAVGLPITIVVEEVAEEKTAEAAPKKKSGKKPAAKKPAAQSAKTKAKKEAA